MALAGASRKNQLLELVNIDTGKSFTPISISTLKPIGYPGDWFAQLIDMFLSKFPKHPYIKSRMGTIITRFEGCAALTSMTYAHKFLGFSGVYDLCKWVMSESAAAEVSQMYEKIDEMAKADSYFPYMMSMRLTERSPYSSASNPSVFLLLHIVGSVYQLGRSLNAILPHDVDYNTISLNAAVLILSHKFKKDLRLRLMSKEEIKT